MSNGSTAGARSAGECKNLAMGDHQRCRLSVAGGEVELAGPPDALRALSALLRRDVERTAAAITGGAVEQEVTSGPLLIGVRDATLRVSGGREYLDIFWEALDGVAEQAETADNRCVNRHQHLESYPGDKYLSPDSTPLIVIADWPDEPAQPH